jgi:hypothetical protein
MFSLAGFSTSSERVFRFVVVIAVVRVALTFAAAVVIFVVLIVASAALAAARALVTRLGGDWSMMSVFSR